MKPIPAGATILLDSGPLVFLTRDTQESRRLLDGLRTEGPGLQFASCAVTLAEALVGAERLRWGAERRALFAELAGRMRPFELSLDPTEVIETYVHLLFRVQKLGGGMGVHDLWVSAASVVHDGWILTFDRDFDLLHQAGVLRRVLYDKRTGVRLD